MPKNLKVLFESLKLGQGFQTEDRTILERDLILGFLWEGDSQIHSDKEMMKESQFGERIMHGNSVTSMALGMFFKLIIPTSMRIEIEKLSCTYLAPVFIGDIIYSKFKLISKNSINDRYLRLAFDFDIFKNRSRIISKGNLLFNTKINNG